MNTTLSIARTAFRVSSALDLYYPDEAGPMQEFTGGVPSEFDINLSVEILQNCDTDFSSMKTAAEAEDAWKLLDDGENRWFVSCFNTPSGKPAWAASMNGNCSCVSIEYYSSADSKTGRVPNPLMYPLDQLLLIHALASRRGLLVHGTGVRKGDVAVVLAGVSGAGKTTVSQLIDGSDDYEILSDDRVFIRERDGELMVYGTPWPGEGGFAMNEGGRLKSVCMLRQGEVNELKPLDARSVLEGLMPVSSVPWYDEKLMGLVMDFAGSVAENTDGYDFMFRKDAGAVELLGDLF